MKIKEVIKELLNYDIEKELYIINNKDDTFIKVKGAILWQKKVFIQI